MSEPAGARNRLGEAAAPAAPAGQPERLAERQPGEGGREARRGDAPVVEAIEDELVAGNVTFRAEVVERLASGAGQVRHPVRPRGEGIQELVDGSA